MKVHPDFYGFILSLKKNNVDYVIVGAFALALYGHPRATGDIDIWIRPSAENAARLMKALRNFGFAPADITAGDILSGKVIQIGDPPVSIDILTRLTGLTDDEIWDGRVEAPFGDLTACYIGRESFLKNKRSLGRNRDLADIDALTS
ncbi:MAG TPA: hypothetical protein PK307_08710 [Spirochaetota bacterium]|nr:hypothetical protein [Spirochaetota bacterium]HOD16358.1 hypothetical protein [Spirochaetota bacterium]HPG52471.1 hypothetical protein [Spirochaetota bacterium]HPN10857.1 hypothetical protein [Spirochaetota bacterium]HQL82267.1 hypothetical protein [Spirochaetota bacterium]